ncbi:CHRD domain-containing protein, partial [Methylobacterium oxalidis]
VIFDSTALAANYTFRIEGIDFGLATGRPAQTPATADDVTSTHFHNQVRGQNGPVVFGQINPAQDTDDLAVVPNTDGSWTVSGRWERTDPANVSIANFASVLGAAAVGTEVPLYFNVHTAQFPGGAVRGQLLTIADDGDNAVAGTSGADILPGLGGNDTFGGSPGNDAVSGGSGTDRAIFSFALGAAQVGTTADGATTIAGPEGTDTFRGIEVFQFGDRTVAVNDGSPLVDDLFYLIRNPDVAAAGIDPDSHYAQFGWREGRDPNAFFSTDGYLAAHPDVAFSGVNPLEHFAQIGWREARDPGANFDIEAYLRANPDVAAANINPLTHFLAFGQEEGRTAFPTIGRARDIGPAGFDAEFYLLANGDVADAARVAGGNTFVFAAQHYDRFGWREGRDPNTVFDTSGYLAAYGDVAAAGINPLIHYNQFGFREGRDPSTEFDTTA